MKGEGATKDRTSYPATPFIPLFIRSSMSGLSPDLGVIWVLHSTPEGSIVTPLPDTTLSGGKHPDWVLIDGLQVGEGGERALEGREGKGGQLWDAAQQASGQGAHRWLADGRGGVRAWGAMVQGSMAVRGSVRVKASGLGAN